MALPIIVNLFTMVQKQWKNVNFVMNGQHRKCRGLLWQLIDAEAAYQKALALAGDGQSFITQKIGGPPEEGKR